MTYISDILGTGADHLYTLDNTASDENGTAADGTTTGSSYTTSPLCEGATNALLLDTVTDRFTFPVVNAITGQKSRKAIAGWFSTTAVQQPPCAIYTEGRATEHSWKIVLGFGNSVLFEWDFGTTVIKIFADVDLVPNRAYHFCMSFEGTGFNNFCKAYLDGVPQTDSTDTASDETVMTARTLSEIGGSSDTQQIDNTTILTVSPVNGLYNYWAFLDGGASGNLFDTKVREIYFEKGALADQTVSSGTQAQMQSSLDAFQNTTRPNVPLAIRIEAVSGDGDLTLNVNNIVFDPLSSIHVQYMGTGTLTLVNIGSSNTSIKSTPNAGTVTIVTPKVLTVTDLVANSEVRVYEAGTTTELGGVENSGTEFTLTLAENNPIDIRILSIGFQNKAIKNVATTSDVTVVAGQIVDRQYENPS